MLTHDHKDNNDEESGAESVDEEGLGFKPVFTPRGKKPLPLRLSVILKIQIKKYRFPSTRAREVSVIPANSIPASDGRIHWNRLPTWRKFQTRGSQPDIQGSTVSPDGWEGNRARLAKSRSGH